jgi:CelD/BcsL family acetyltransferase involved in cellulose biosynthesis
VRIVSPEEFQSAEFASKWRDFLSSGIEHDLGQSNGWNVCWWQRYGAFGPSAKSLFCLVAEGGGRIDAIWPLFMAARHGLKILHWIGQAEGMITDYMLPLVRPGLLEPAIREFYEFLAEQRSNWDVLDITIPAWTNHFSSFIRAAVVHGSKAGLAWNIEISDQSAAVDLPASFDAYLASLGQKTRSHLKQYLRAADKAGVRLECFSGQDLAAGLSDLFRINNERWQVFTDERPRAFLADLATDRHREGAASIVRLRHNDESLATAFCFENTGRFFVHSAGVVRKTVQGFNPGTVMYGLLIRSLIERGFRRLDFSPGLEEYKLRLGATVEPLIRLTMWSTSSRIKRWRALGAYRRVKSELKNVLPLRRAPATAEE